MLDKNKRLQCKDMRLNNLLSYCKGTTKVKLINYYNKSEILYEGDANSFFHLGIDEDFEDKGAFHISIQDNILIAEIASVNKDELVDFISNLKNTMEDLTEQLDDFVEKYK